MEIIYKLAFLFLFQFLFSLDQPLEYAPSSVRPAPEDEPKLEKNGALKIIFKSSDGGHTWQDISNGLPENLEEGGFLANETGLYLGGGNGIYQSNPNSPVPSWKKEVFPVKAGSFARGKAGIYAYDYGGKILQKVSGTNLWSPIYSNFTGSIRTVFETAGGNVFIGSDNGLFKSANSGRTWKHVHAGGWVIKLVESNGVLVATSMSGIIRSTDGGENWAVVISEGGVGIDVSRIEGGFAAISFNSRSNTRRVRASYDGGETWQPIDAGLQAQPFSASKKPLFQVNLTDSVWNPINSGLPEQAFISSIVQVGKYFFCGHPAGIFRSADKGKTWDLVLPSVNNKVFNLTVSGDVIYAIPRNAGC